MDVETKRISFYYKKKTDTVYYYDNKYVGKSFDDIIRSILQGYQQDGNYIIQIEKQNVLNTLNRDD